MLAENHRQAAEDIEKTIAQLQTTSYAAQWWENLEHIRQGGWYGNNTDSMAVQYAFDLLAKIHEWALQ